MLDYLAALPPIASGFFGSFVAGLGTGVEPVGGLIGATAVTASDAILP